MPDVAMIERIQEENRQSYIGKKFILRSNEDEPIKVGTLVSWEKKGNYYLPWVDVEGEKFLAFSIMIPWNAMFEDILLNWMTPAEGYEYLKKLKIWWVEF